MRYAEYEPKIFTNIPLIYYQLLLFDFRYWSSCVDRVNEVDRVGGVEIIFFFVC
jgi:hypothetical protein